MRNPILNINSVICKKNLIPLNVDFSLFLINPLKTKRRLLYLKTQFVPRSKRFSSRL